MPASPRTIEQHRETLALVQRHGGVTKAALATGLNRQTLQSRYRNATVALQKQKLRVRVKAGTSRHFPQKAASVEAPVPDSTPIEASIQKHMDDNTATYLRRRVRELTDQLVEERAWRKALEDLRSVPHSSVEWTPKAPAVHGASFLTPVLFTSDFQVGEVVRPEEIDGINRYDQDVFVSRYQTLIEKTIELLSAHVGHAEFPGIYYLRGGDAISGEIHDELAETNDLSAVPALRLLQRQEREGIRRLRDAFGRVRVLSIPGNHGRTTRKPRSSGYTERNFETLLSWWLADAFSDDPAVTFSIPPSGDAYFQIERWGFLLAHGDRMGSKGGKGFIGPAATIARGHQRLYQNWTLTGRPVHVINTGHLHTSLKLERGFGNGSLVGYNAYARDLQATPDAAKQWLYTVHKDRPVANMFEIELSPRPQRVLIESGGLE